MCAVIVVKLGCNLFSMSLSFTCFTNFSVLMGLSKICLSAVCTLPREERSIKLLGSIKIEYFNKLPYFPEFCPPRNFVYTGSFSCTFAPFSAVSPFTVCSHPQPNSPHSQLSSNIHIAYHVTPSQRTAGRNCWNRRGWTWSSTRK